jgi:IS30 family transposase
MSQFSISGRVISKQRAAIPREPSSGRATTWAIPAARGWPKRYDNCPRPLQQRKEGDLIIGPHNRSAIGTLVERTTRAVRLLHLTGRDSATLHAAIRERMSDLRAALFRSITWDQGIEMARHRTIAAEFGIDVFFADAHSPWQRGSNERTNGLLRQYSQRDESQSPQP